MEEESVCEGALCRYHPSLSTGEVSGSLAVA